MNQRLRWTLPFLYTALGVPAASAAVETKPTTLQVDIFCGEMHTPTDFRFALDGRLAGKTQVQFEGRLPCLGRFITSVAPGDHTLRIESKKLNTSASLPIVVQPGQNWVVVNPSRESTENHIQWKLFIEQHRAQPQPQ